MINKNTNMHNKEKNPLSIKKFKSNPTKKEEKQLKW